MHLLIVKLWQMDPLYMELEFGSTHVVWFLIVLKIYIKITVYIIDQETLLNTIN